MTHLAKSRWPFRLHATYDETITRALDVFESVNREVPFAGLRWFFDHAETISPRNIERVKALGGGIAIQHRMAFQGEYFVAALRGQGGRERAAHRAHAADGRARGRGDRRDARRQLQPLRLPLLARHGQDASAARRSTARPTASIGWRRCASGRSGSAWFSGEDARKGTMAPGQLADLAVLSGDYFSVPEEQIKGLESVLTLVGGKVVHAAQAFALARAAAAPRRAELGTRHGRRVAAPPKARAG